MNKLETEGKRKIVLGLTFQRKFSLRFESVRVENIFSTFGASDFSGLVNCNDVSVNLSRGTTHRAFILRSLNQVYLNSIRKKETVSEKDLIAGLNILTSIISKSQLKTLKNNDFISMKPLFGLMMQNLIKIKGSHKLAFESISMNDETANYLNQDVSYYG